jgi:predicted flap endonuclease-1-like 5' DNA nuclease
MTSMMILGAIIMLLIGIVFGFIASGTGAKIAEPAPAQKRKTAAKQKDDLKKISGVGPAIEKKLHKMGVTRYRQIANWKAADINKADDALNFKGRIKRENWVRQAKTLASGGETEFSKRQK